MSTSFSKLPSVSSEPVTPRTAARSHHLKSYIAPSAPATRRECDGTEPDLRVEFGFTPKWFNRNCGIDFSERWHEDPLYRRDTTIRMKEELNRRFPGLQLGGENPRETVSSLDGVHGALTIALLFGIPAVYYRDNWPAAEPEFLSPKQIARLEPPDLAETPVFQQILQQMETIEQECGRIEGFINWQGVLNNAFRIRGPEILSDLVLDPALAHHLFEVVTETMISGAKTVYARQAETGVTIRHFTVSNCVVNMISPELYREHLMPYDRKVSETFELFGIHNCAWNVDPYLPHYAEIRTLGYVDMGLESDLKKARELCPDTRRAVMYKPTDLKNKSESEIHADLARIHDQLSPCDIVMADIDYGTPDERVRVFAEMADRISRNV